MAWYSLLHGLPIVILLLLSGAGSAILSQSDIRFEHISAEYDLSSNVVTCIFQDKKGFMWIGTEDGLNRFDGYEMVTFRHHPEDQGSISSNWVFSMLEDREGRIWVGTKAGLNLLHTATGEFEQFLEYSLDTVKIRLDDIYVMYEDGAGNLWLGSDRLHKWNLATQQFTYFPLLDVAPEKIQRINFIGEDHQGRLLVGSNVGLLGWDEETNRFRFFGLSARPDRADVNYGIRSYWANAPDYLFIAGQQDLIRLDLRKNQLDTLARGIFADLDYWNDKMITGDAEGALWLGTKDGLHRIDPVLGLTTTFVHDPQNPNSIAKGVVDRLFFDHQGTLWTGGASVLDRLSFNYLDQVAHPGKAASFSHLQVVPGGDLPDSQKMIRSFLRDRKGYFWVGTYDGLFRFPPDSLSGGRMEHFFHDPNRINSLSGNGIRALLEDHRGDIWVATTKGLNRIDANTGQIERVLFQQLSPRTMADEVFWSLFEDDQDSLWIGTMSNGLLCLDPTRRRTHHFMDRPEDKTTLLKNEVLTIFQDREGRIWVGTYGGGLNLYHPSDRTFSHFLNDPKDPGSISSNIVWSILEDDQHRLWIGTQDGLNQLIADKQGGTVSYRFERFLEEDGLINNSIFSMLPDEQGRLWLSTLKGLSCFIPEGKSFLNFSVEDGLQAYTFTPNAYYKDPRTGELFFGGINGYNRFQPTHFKADTFAPPVIISSLTRFNKKENEGKPIIDHFTTGKTSFRFSYLDDILIFNLALLNYQRTEKNKYEYRLEGLQSHWVPLGTDRKITFTNLNAGHYTLSLRGANHNDVWVNEETSIAITVVPPWWWTNLAKIIYLVLGLAAILAVYRYQLRKKLVEQEARQLKELDELKSRFFINISHEFRTPLTVISGMVIQMRQQPEQWLEKGMDLIQRNSTQLLSLINQILDLRKLESGALKVNLVRGNIIPYLHYLAESFVPLAQSKGIRVHFLSTLSELEMDYDPDKILHILSNLLSNAIKYMPGPGDIYLQVDHRSEAGGEQLVILVRDTGPGISAEALPHIFDRFYQADPDHYPSGEQQPQGTGVGLTLTQELVILLGGSIRADSVKGAGTTFTVSLPVTRNAPVQEGTVGRSVPEVGSPVPSNPVSVLTPSLSPIPEPAPVTAIPTNDTGQASLLIVEDNPDVRLYLQACLQPHYHLLMAENGQEGIDLAVEKTPDLIVSDVMMPVKDGFALCDTLKNDERTSHIPIVLLTARADFESRIKGLRKGADDYLSKPFEREELLVRLEQLLVLRKKLQERYRNLYVAEKLDASAGELPLQPEAVELEDAFLQKTRQFILDHIAEEDLGVLHLQRALALSRTQLHHKIKALTGLSTTALIRSIRMHKARELLLTTDLNVSEVGYEVGINNPAYFSRLYAEAFSEPPRETRK